MPFKSRAQRGFFHANEAKLERQGVNVHEWDEASKGLKLPERKKPMMAKKFAQQSAGEKKYGKTPAEKQNVTKPKSVGPARVKLGRAFKSS